MLWYARHHETVMPLMPAFRMGLITLCGTYLFGHAALKGYLPV